jgi:putative MFS transporter
MAHMAEGKLSVAEQVSRIVGRIERLPSTRTTVKLRVIIGTATFFDLFDALSIAYILPILAPMWHLSHAKIGLLISISYIGQILGAVLLGWIAEKWGRRPSVMITIIIFAACSLCCASSPTYGWLFVFRAIQGLGLGGEIPVAAAYISEFATAERRGFFVLIYQLTTSFGVFGASIVGLFVIPAFGWRAMFIIGALPALCVFFFLRGGVPESPRWLAAKGRYPEADQIVSTMEIEASKGGTVLLRPPVAKPVVAEEKTRLAELLEGIYRRRTLTIWAIMFASYFALFGLFTWMPTLYTTVYKLPLKTAYRFSAVTTFASFLSTIYPPLIIDRIGRKTLLQWALLLGAVALVVLLVMGGTRSPVTLMTLSSLSILFVGGVCCSCYVYLPENYPTRMRALGTSVGAGWRSVSSGVAPYVMGYILPAFGVRGIILLIGVVLFAGAAIAWTFAIETNRRVLEDLSP